MGSKEDVDGRRNGWTRPIALPNDLDDPNRITETGTVRLPLHVFWSGPDRTWNLDDSRQRVQVYEVVLTEGTEDDVRRFIDVDSLIQLWPRLWLPSHVRLAWTNHLRLLRGVELAC